MAVESNWQKVDEIYRLALQQEPGRREEFLREACAGDDALRAEVESLLGYDDKAGSFLEPPEDPEPAHSMAEGETLGHYSILEKLGQGGMGVVYKARDTRLNRLVAIKMLPRRLMAVPERRARFAQEARAASALNHANIVTIYDIGEAEGRHFIAMEYVEGSTLDRLIPRKGMRIADVLQYAIQIADALTRAHSAGVIHRDLKPGNIMVTPVGQVKIVDFGLAKLAPTGMPEARPSSSEPAATASLTVPQTGERAILGTAAYMSPEQAEGERVDFRSDIFSFGIVLYEMLTGTRPFSGATRVSTMAAIVNQEPKPAGLIVNALPPELDRIIARCLRKDPARRFQTMADLKVALEELKEESDSGRLTGSAPLPKPRKRVWVVGLAIAVLVLAAGGVWLAKNRSGPAAPQTVVQVTSYAGAEYSPTLSPDGNQVAFHWGGKENDNWDIYVQVIGETSALRLTTDAADDVWPAWSPDGKRIAFQRKDKTSGFKGIYTISQLGGSEQKLTDFHVEGQMSWSPDGKWLAVSSDLPEQCGIFLLPVDGGEPRRISDPKPSCVDGTPSISPGGHFLAYTSWPDDLYVQALDSSYTPQGVRRRIAHPGILVGGAGLAWSGDEESLISVDATPHSYLWRIRVDGNKPPERLDIAGISACFPSVARTGNRLVFSRYTWDWDIWRYVVGSNTVERLIGSSLDELSPQLSPDGTKLAFESTRSGTYEIWLANADGSHEVQLTNRVGLMQANPRWSPDGRRIAFESLGPDDHWHIWVVEGSGGRPRRITRERLNETLPSWSRDGKWIYFSSDRTGKLQIWRVRFAGGSPEQVTSNGGHTAFESADGTSVFYSKDDSSPLFNKALSGGPEQQVLPYIEQRAFMPVKDGIYYIGRRRDDGTFPLEFYRFDSKMSRLLTTIDAPEARGSAVQGLTVSADRKTILFSRTLSGGADLMMIENFR